MSKPPFDPSKPFQPGQDAMPAAPSKPAFDPSKPFKPAEDPNDKPIEAGLTATANSGLLGYLPQVQAGAENLVNKVTQYIPGTSANILKTMQEKGQDVHVPTYDELLAEDKGDIGKLAASNPKATLAGSIGGAVLQAPALTAGLGAVGLGAGGGLLARLGKSAAAGGLIGAAANPQEGQTRLGNLEQGGLTGLAGQAGGEVLNAGLSSLKTAAPKLADLAGALASKAAGAMKKNFADKNIVETGKFALENNLVAPGDTFSTIADKTKSLLNKVGPKIGDVYDKIGNFPVNTTELGNKLTQAAMKQLPKVGAKNLASMAQDQIDEILSNPGVAKGDVREINDVISSLSKQINWQKKASVFGQGVPQGQEVTASIRNALRDELNTIAKQSGSPELIELNRQYSNASKIADMANEGIARDRANTLFGLTGSIAGGALAAGSLASDRHGGGESNYLKALMLGLAGAGGTKLVRSYGNPMLAKGLMAASRGAAKAAPIAGLIPQGLLNAAQNPATQILQASKSGRPAQ